MAILYGTQSNGETLPVLVDQFGNLLAKGIEGPPGQEGPPGADGGDFPLPPDPYEGAFLGWLNNGLAWIGTPPVPVPEGRFGPITGWDPAGLLTVGGEIPEQIKQGVFVYQCNEDGSIYVDGWNNSQNWSDDVEVTNGTGLAGRSPSLMFNGDISYSATGVFGTDNGVGKQIVYTPSTDIPISSYVSINANGIQSFEVITSKGTFTESISSTGVNVWKQITADGTLTSISFTSTSPTNGANCAAISVDDVLLVDSGEYPSAPNLNFRVQSVSGQNLIGVANRTNDFTIGKYLRVPEQNVARWLYDGNLNKVITSTGIDISRLTGN